MGDLQDMQVFISTFLVVFAVLKLRNFGLTQQNSDRMSTMVYLCHCAFGVVCVDVHSAWVACLLVWVMAAKAGVQNEQQQPTLFYEFARKY